MATLAVAATLAVLGPPSARASSTPTDIAFDSLSNQLVQTYSDPNIANAADYVTGSTSKPIAAKLAVCFIYSGSNWSNYSNVKAQYTSFFPALFGSAYFAALKQYGFQSVVYNGVTTDTSTSAINGTTFTDAQLEAVVNANKGKFSIPSGYGAFYLVLPPPNVAGPGGSGGEHIAYTGPGGGVLLAGWARSTDIIAHEIVETITDPRPNQNWQMDRDFEGREIGDAGEKVSDTLPWSLPFTNKVEPYWSQNQRACIIPAGTPGQAGGNAITSYFDGASLHVFYLGQDRHVHELISIGNPATWVADDPCMTSGAPFARGATGLTGFWDATTGTGHVFYTAQNGDIEELAATDGSGNNWICNDLQNVAAARAGLSAGSYPTVRLDAEGGRSLTSFANPHDASFNVAFLDSTLGLSELKYTQGTSWQMLAGPSPGGMYTSPKTQVASLYDGDGYDHLFLFDGNGHLREVYPYASAPWQSFDLSTSLPNTPLPSPIAIAATSDATDIAPVDDLFYIDTNNHIQAITRFYGAYASLDLSAGLATSLLPGAPALSCVHDGAGRIHLFYIGQDAKVHRYTRIAFQAYFDGAGHPVAAATWQTADTPATPSGRPYALRSLALSSSYSAKYDVVGAFDLSETSNAPTTDMGPVGIALYNGSTWSASAPGIGLNAPLALP